MSSVEIAIFCLGCVALGHGMAHLAKQYWRRRRERTQTSGDVEAFSDPGVAVEVDCRACGQFNRVRAHRLRDRPKCGRCKARLMPGKRVVICRVSQMDRTLARELDAVWKDEDQLWKSLADHVALENKARAEAKNPDLRMVN